MPDENGVIDPQEFSLITHEADNQYFKTWDEYHAARVIASGLAADVSRLEGVVAQRDAQIAALILHDATHHQPPPDTTAPTTPGRPTGASTSPNSINLGWPASTDTGGGAVRYAVFQDNSTTPVVDNVAANSVTISGLAAGSSHTYRVQAKDQAGNVSAFSLASLPIIVQIPVPTKKPMKVGVIIGTACGNLNTVRADYGGNPGVRRYFSSAPFDDIDNNPSVAADMGTIDRCISYKASEWTTAVENNALRCFRSIPSDGRRTWIWAQNEPERSDKSEFGPGASNAAGANFVEYITEFIDFASDWVLNEGRLDDVGFGWSFSYWRLKTDPTIVNWLPHSPNNKYATLGIQSYNPQPQNNQTLRMQTEPGVDHWEAVGGKKWALSEVNAKNGFAIFSERDPRPIPSPYNSGANGVDWWTNPNNGLPWASGAGCEFATIYLDNVGQDKPWCIGNDTVRNALGAMMPQIP